MPRDTICGIIMSMDDKTTTGAGSGKYITGGTLPDGREILDVKIGNRYRKTLLIPCAMCSNPVWKLTTDIDKQCWRCHVSKKQDIPHKTGRYTKDYKRLYYYKRGATARNLDWELSTDKAYEMFRKNCYYCGSLPQPLNGIDRLDSSLGYTERNTVPCCRLCNKAKSNTDLSEWNDWLRRVVDYYPTYKEILGE